MQAYAGASIANTIGRILEEGKIYLIKNFEVKQYTELDKFRPVPIDRQITFSSDTRIGDVDEKSVFIPKNMFDFFQFCELKNAAKQVTHLTGILLLPSFHEV